MSDYQVSNEVRAKATSVKPRAATLAQSNVAGQFKGGRRNKTFPDIVQEITIWPKKK